MERGAPKSGIVVGNRPKKRNPPLPPPQRVVKPEGKGNEWCAALGFWNVERERNSKNYERCRQSISILSLSSYNDQVLEFWRALEREREFWRWVGIPRGWDLLRGEGRSPSCPSFLGLWEAPIRALVPDLWRFPATMVMAPGSCNCGGTKRCGALWRWHHSIVFLQPHPSGLVVSIIIVVQFCSFCFLFFFFVLFFYCTFFSL